MKLRSLGLLAWCLALLVLLPRRGQFLAERAARTVLRSEVSRLLQSTNDAMVGDVLVVLDWTVPYWQRKLLKEFAADLVFNIGSNSNDWGLNVGVVLFHENVSYELPLSDDYAALEDHLLDPTFAADFNTSGPVPRRTALALETCSNIVLERGRAPVNTAVLVLTAGVSEDVSRTIQRAAELKVEMQAVIFAIAMDPAESRDPSRNLELEGLSTDSQREFNVVLSPPSTTSTSSTASATVTSFTATSTVTTSSATTSSATTSTATTSTATVTTSTATTSTATTSTATTSTATVTTSTATTSTATTSTATTSTDTTSTATRTSSTLTSATTTYTTTFTNDTVNGTNGTNGTTTTETSTTTFHTTSTNNATNATVTTTTSMTTFTTVDERRLFGTGTTIDIRDLASLLGFDLLDFFTELFDSLTTTSTTEPPPYQGAGGLAAGMVVVIILLTCCVICVLMAIAYYAWQSLVASEQRIAPLTTTSVVPPMPAPPRPPPPQPRDATQKALKQAIDMQDVTRLRTLLSEILLKGWPEKKYTDLVLKALEVVATLKESAAEVLEEALSHGHLPPGSLADARFAGVDRELLLRAEGLRQRSGGTSQSLA